MKNCFLFGHRDAPESIYPRLLAAIEKYYREYEVREFIVGLYGGFDRMAARAVSELKNSLPGISLVLLSAYNPAERPIKDKKGADEIIYPLDLEKNPRRLAIVKANRYAIDHTEYIIAYVNFSATNSYKMYEYALHRSKNHTLHVENIGVCATDYI